MPPKRVAAAGPAGRPPKKSKLCVEIPSKFEIDGNPTLIVGKEIGNGGFARVYAGEIKNLKKPCAIKVEPSANGCLYVEQKLFQSILTEKALEAYKLKNKLKWLGLPHCVRFGVFTFKAQELRFISMPLYNSSLQAYIDARPGKVLTYAEVQKFLFIIIDAYEYLHSENVVHADLKAENLMFPLNDKNNLQKLTLIDFGIAQRMANKMVEQPKPKQAHNGTAYYTSTDAHRGCSATFRGDYEILGHNLLTWFAGLNKLPWEAHAKKNTSKELDQVHELKRQYIDSPTLVKKLISNADAASLVSKIYKLASSTGYTERVKLTGIKVVR
ncbi:Serine/threonine-protein kinase VRK1 [Aphelenchoides besseyi]|nr:Serine/threonine-protein kinase VRK1 [Aphelenchoides besseyi]